MLDWIKRHPPPVWAVMFLWGLAFGLQAPSVATWLRGLVCASGNP